MQGHHSLVKERRRRALHRATLTTICSRPRSAVVMITRTPRCSRGHSGNMVERDVVDRAYDEPRSVTQLERNGYFCVDAAGSPAIASPSGCPALHWY